MKKPFCVILTIFILFAAFLPPVRAAEIFDVPLVTLIRETAGENDRTFSFSVDCGDAAGYERQRRSVVSGLVAEYGSEALARAALIAAGQEELLYPAVLYVELETGGYTVMLGVYGADETALTLTLQNDILPAMVETGLYTHEAFTFRLRFSIAVLYDGTPSRASAIISEERTFSCPATARLVYRVPADAVNPNPSFPYLPYAGFYLAYPTRTGYTFAGWTDDDTGAYVSYVQPNTLDRSFTAVFKPRTFAISYVLTTRPGYSFVQIDNKGNPKTREYGNETEIYAVTPPYGYLFLGWYDNPALTGDPVTSIPADKLGDTVLYAKWATEQEVEDALIKEKGYGDVDGDGQIRAADARLALRAAVRLETLTPAQLTSANVTGSGLVSAADAREILRISVGLETLAEVLKYYGIL